MPASSTIPNTVQVRLLFAYGVDGGVNVLHAIAQAGFVVNQAAANTLGSAIKAAFTANMAASCHTSTQLVRVGLRDRRTPNAPEFLDTGGAVSGTEATTDAMPHQIALCITLRTGLSGKSFRGRVYLGGFSELGSGATGTANAGPVTSCTNFITAIQTAMTGQGLTLAVASRGADAAVATLTTTHQDGSTTTETLYRIRDKAAQSNAVTIIQSRNNAWETQRRRNNGRGSLPTVFNGTTEVHLP